MLGKTLTRRRHKNRHLSKDKNADGEQMKLLFSISAKLVLMLDIRKLSDVDEVAGIDVPAVWCLKITQRNPFASGVIVSA